MTDRKCNPFTYASVTATVKVAVGILFTLTLVLAGAEGAAGQPVDGKVLMPIPKAEPPADPKHKEQYAQEYVHSFKTDRELGPEFHWHGLDPQGCVTFEPAGLMINLPEGHPGKRMGTGIGINTPVKGDFEITIRYELLKEPSRADAGQGTGLFIWIDLDKPKLNRGFISRVSRPGKEFVTWYHLTRDGAEKPVDALRGFPAKEASGRLRLVRTGSTLYHYVADGAGEQFTLLNQHPFGAEDLQAIRWGGQTGGERASLEGRFLDLRIRADELPELRTVNPAAAPVQGDGAVSPRTSGSWLAIGLAIGLAVILAFALLAGLMLYMRKNRPHAAAPLAAKPSTASEATPRISFACPDCSKRIQARSELIGKKVKCPHCGSAARVPATEATVED